MPNGEDDPAFTADEPAIRAERDVAQSELDVGVVVVVVVFFFVVDEGEFEDVRALSRSSVWVVCDWPGARADAEEGAVEEELRGRCATSSGEAAACSFVSGMTRNSNGTRKVTPARQTVPSAPKFTAVPETVS